MEFKDRLKKLRTEHEMSLQDLANMVGISRAAIGNYEAGIRMPRQEQLEAIADVFNVDLDYLTGRSEEPLKKSFSENRILYLTRLLNEKGKEEAVKRVRELTFIPEYTVNNILIAAHAHDSATAEELQEDINIIMGEGDNGNTGAMD